MCRPCTVEGLERVGGGVDASCMGYPLSGDQEGRREGPPKFFVIMCFGGSGGLRESVASCLRVLWSE